MPRPRATWHLSAALLLRGFGAVYLIAFVSLWVQIDGLIGTSGILPATEFLTHVRAYATTHDRTAFSIAPTLCLWLGASNATLHALCAAGTLAALLLIAGLLPGPLLALLWLLYLSLTVVGQTFLGFQWENLLLESGLIAILLAPPVLRHPLPKLTPNLNLNPSPPVEERSVRRLLLRAPDHLARALLWWLLFRLMLQSGLVKLASNDTVWWDLTALTCHYWTQPLPTWTSYYANLLPLGFQKFSVAFTYAIELILPFLILLPGRLRLIPFAGFTLLMLLIALTGNYTYFTLLTALLAFSLLNDRCLPRLPLAGVTDARVPTAPAIANLKSSIIHSFSLLRLAALLLYLSETLPITTLYLHATLHRFAAVAEHRLGLAIPIPPPSPGPFTQARLNRWSPSRAANSYGLFANMTEHRPEIIIEGSHDGATWLPYEFRYKPGDPARRPRFVQPHQPRLDWQMWFAALGRAQENPWLVNLMDRILRASPPVLGLLAANPFPDAPPRYLRATVWEYTFATPAEKAATGHWWTRSNPRPYTPTLTLRDDRLAIAP